MVRKGTKWAVSWAQPSGVDSVPQSWDFVRTTALGGRRIQSLGDDIGESAAEIRFPLDPGSQMSDV